MTRRKISRTNHLFEAPRRKQRGMRSHFGSIKRIPWLYTKGLHKLRRRAVTGKRRLQ